MNILFISQDGLSDDLGQSPILPYILGLHGSDLSYTIISMEKHSVSDRIEAVKSILEKSGIQWIKLDYSSGKGIYSSLLNLIRLRKAITAEIRKKKYDAFHCRSYVVQLAAFTQAKKNGIKIIFDMRGFWADERIEGGIWNRSNGIMNMIYSYFKKKEKTWLRQSDLIISLTMNAKEIIRKMMVPDLITNIHVIPCCADEMLFDRSKIRPEDLERVRSETGIRKDEKVLGYAGSIGTWYLLDKMLNFFSEAKQSGKFNKFLLLTSGEENTIQRAARQYGLSNDSIVVRRAARMQMPHYYSLFDYGIFYIRPSFSKTASSPTKLGEMLLMGIPIICNRGVGDLDSFFAGSKVGFCHDFNETVNVLNMLNSLPAAGSTEIRETGIRHFSLSKGLELYRNAIASLQLHS